jgi:hypothetical protein
MGAGYARLHTATYGRAETFAAAVRDLVELEAECGVQIEARRLLDARERVAAWWNAAGCPSPAGFDVCVKRVAAGHAEPGPLVAFTHGDPAPTNALFTGDGSLRLVDFEYGAYRHGLYDLTAWVMLCPLPRELVATLRRSYLRNLTRAVPATRDDEYVARAWADVCAFRALSILTWIPPTVLGANRPWADGWTAREAVLTTARRLAGVTAGFEDLAPLCRAAASLHAALAARWPEHAGALPRWPALSREPAHARRVSLRASRPRVIGGLPAPDERA